MSPPHSRQSWSASAANARNLLTRGALARKTDLTALVHATVCNCMSGNCSNSNETGTDHFDSDDDSDDE